MKKLLLAAVLLSLNGCHYNQERNIRKSIDRYMEKIQGDRMSKYDIQFTVFNEADFISILRKENNDNCDTARELRAKTLLQHKAILENGLPLTGTEMQYDSTAPEDVFSKIDDSLSRLKPDIHKVYYKVFAYSIDTKDTVWKNTFWMDEDYKIVW